LTLEFLDWFQILKSLIFQIVSFIGAYYLLIDVYSSVAFFYLICYYFHLKSQKLNERILLLIKMSRFNNPSLKNSSIAKLVIDHNSFCSKVKLYNEFWKKPFLSFIIVLVPSNLVALHQLLFEETKTYILIINTLIVLYGFFFIFFLSFYTSSLSQQIHNSAKNLLLLQLRCTGLIINNKLKLMICFERLSSKRKIGFSLDLYL
jgi:hypothetical protein